MNGARHGSDASYTKKSEEKTHTGVPITLSLVHHDEEQCREFIVSSQGFSFRKWFAWTAVFNVGGFLLNLHMQDERVMLYTILLLLLAIAVKMHFKVKQESLLVMRSVGVQHTTTFASGRRTTTFYDVQDLDNVVINEGVTMWKVIFYLTLLIKDSKCSNRQVTRLVPLYKQSWPALACLQKIYLGANAVLFGGRCPGRKPS